MADDLRAVLESLAQVGIALNEKYKTLIEKTNDSNGVFEADYEYIVELYKNG